MASNQRSKSATWGYGDKVLNTHFETVESNAARAVARIGTKSGAVNFPIIPMGSHDKTMCGVTVSSVGTTHMTKDVSWFGLALDRLPDAHTLVSVSVKFAPVTGHAATVAYLPAIKVLKISTAGAASNVGSATAGVWGDYASAGAYETPFTLQADCGNEVIDLEAYRYVLWVQTESGSNSITSCAISNVKVTMTMDTASGGTDLNCWLAND